MQNHKYSLEDINNMLPWEREIYLTLLLDDLKKIKEQQQQQAMHR